MSVSINNRQSSLRTYLGWMTGMLNTNLRITRRHVIGHTSMLSNKQSLRGWGHSFLFDTTGIRSLMGVGVNALN